MARVNPAKIKYLYNQIASQQKELVIDDPQKQMYIFPFTGVLGFINTTSAGYKPANTIVNDFSTYARVFNGEESVLFVHDNSYTITQKNKDAIDGSSYIDKTYKVGDFLHGIPLTVDNRVEFSAGEFTEEVNIKSMTIQINPSSLNLGEGDKNKIIAEDINQYLYKFYIIPETSYFQEKQEFVNNQSSSNLYKDEDKQWLYISDIIVKYNGRTQASDIIALEITFSSFSNKMLISGLSINEYVQVARPGQGYSFPYVDKTKPIGQQVQIDKVRTLSTPITHSQLSMYGLSGLNNIKLYGSRIVDKKDSYGNVIGTQILASGRIWPFVYQSPEYDVLSKNGLHSTCFYATQLYESVVDSYFPDWKTQNAGNYDDNATKDFEGHFRPSTTIPKGGTKVDSTIDTNPVDATNNRQVYWDENFLNTKGFIDYDYNVQASECFVINPRSMAKAKNDPKYNTYPETLGDKTFNPSTMPKKGLNQWNMINSLIFEGVYQTTLNLSQTTQYGLSTLPLIGGFLNKLTVGMNLGFKQVKSSDIPKFPVVDFLMDAEVFDSYNKTLYFSGTTAKANAGILPLDVFNNNASSALGSLIGTKSSMTAFCFNLTNWISLQPTAFDGTLLPAEVIETYKLGQIDTTGGTPATNKAYLVNSSIELMDPTRNGKYEGGYGIDAQNFQAFFKGNYRWKHFSQILQPEGVVSDLNSVYQSKHISLSSFCNNTRLWSNNIITSNPTYKFDEPFMFPQQVQNPIPQGGVPTPIEEVIKWDKTSDKITTTGNGSFSTKDNKTYITMNFNAQTVTYTGTFPIQNITDFQIKDVSIPGSLFNVSEEGQGTLSSNQFEDLGYNYSNREIYNAEAFSKNVPLNVLNTLNLNTITFPMRAVSTDTSTLAENPLPTLSITSAITLTATQGTILITFILANTAETSEVTANWDGATRILTGGKDFSGAIDSILNNSLKASVVYEKS